MEISEEKMINRVGNMGNIFEKTSMNGGPIITNLFSFTNKERKASRENSEYKAIKP